MAKYNRLSHTLTKSELWLGWGWLLFQTILLSDLLAIVNASAGYPLGSEWINFIYFCINFLAVSILLRKFLGRSVTHLGANFFRCIKGAFLGFCVYYVTTMALNHLIAALYPAFSNINDGNVASLIRLGNVPMIIGTMFLVPVAEEVLYRGVVFQSLYAVNRFWGHVLSAAIFCAVHIIGYIGTADPLTLALSFIQYIPAALCLAWAYTEADNIFAPIMIHMAVNTMGILAL